MVNRRIIETGPKFLIAVRIFELKNFVASNLTTVIVEKNVPNAIDNATNGIVRFIGSAWSKFLFSDDIASYMKFILSNPLKTSSVNLVQNRINLLEPESPRIVIKALVHNPTQA
mmetsp:Transcript_19496/g.40842  ORF Transcript_19496/g.40842 Transcript_19496/m.40842 type:complete len:114 (-) Transcript_19496:1264-1605(-)